MNRRQSRIARENEVSCSLDVPPGLVWTALSGEQIDILNRRGCEYTGFEADSVRGNHNLGAVENPAVPDTAQVMRTS
jgi:hypothetical protein